MNVELPKCLLDWIYPNLIIDWEHLCYNNSEGAVQLLEKIQIK